MRIIDFEYDGEKLSDYGLMPCYITNSPNETIELGNELSINNVKGQNSQEYYSTGYYYNDAISMSFQACKLECSTDNYKLSGDEINKITRWLNRKRYCVFKPIYEDDDYYNVYYKGTFNVNPILIGDEVVGVDLNFMTNAPYGFVEPIKYKHEFVSTDKDFMINDISDEIGYIYCDVVITCLESGDLKLSNSQCPFNDVVINNCIVGETIIMQGKEKIISSSEPNHNTLPNDFNYNYFRIENKYNDNKNIIKSSIKCKIEITYSPIKKVGLIV